jgi:ferrous iron transport protein A
MKTAKGGTSHMSPLGILSAGDKAEIVEVITQNKNSHGSGKNHICHIEDMGLRKGRVVEILNSEGRGPLLLKMEESRIAIGRGMAMKIMVRKEAS